MPCDCAYPFLAIFGLPCKMCELYYDNSLFADLRSTKHLREAGERKRWLGHTLASSASGSSAASTSGRGTLRTSSLPATTSAIRPVRSPHNPTALYAPHTDFHQTRTAVNRQCWTPILPSTGSFRPVRSPHNPTALYAPHTDSRQSSTGSLRPVWLTPSPPVSQARDQ